MTGFPTPRLMVLEGIDDHDADGRHWSRPIPRDPTIPEVIAWLRERGAIDYAAATWKLMPNFPFHEGFITMADASDVQVEFIRELAGAIVDAALSGEDVEET